MSNGVVVKISWFISFFLWQSLRSRLRERLVPEATFNNVAAKVCFEIYVHVLHGFSRQEILGEEDALPKELVAWYETQGGS